MKDRYIGTAEIVERTGCGRTFANELMHRFEKRGLAYKMGNRFKVKEKVFEDWIEHECRIEVKRRVRI